MKKVLLLICLAIPVGAHAGWLSFFGDVASISSAMNQGAPNVSSEDMKDIKVHLWAMVESGKYEEGWEVYAEILEKSNNLRYLNTAAFAYYGNSNKKKALEIYEERILPTARAIHKRIYEGNYRNIKGLKSDEKIPYGELYKKAKLKRDKLQKEQELQMAKQSEMNAKTPLVEYAIWGVLAVLILNLITNIRILANQKTNKAIMPDS